MINNSGSYFPLILGLIFYMLLKMSLNWMAKKLANFYYLRLIGMWAYEDRYGQNLYNNQVKLFMESYFDLSFANAIGLLAIF